MPRRYASYYWGTYAFKYSLPRCLAAENLVDLGELSTDDLSNYVIPFYYREIGWFDRETVRNDKTMMLKLAESWFDKARIGRLD